MPFHISPSGKGFKVTGLFKGKSGHVYGTHATEEDARAQQKALYANVKEASFRETTLAALQLVAEVVKIAAMEALPHQSRVADTLSDENVSGQLAYHGLGSGKTFTSINAAAKQNMPIMAIVPAPLRNNYLKELRAAGFKHPVMMMSYNEAVRRANDPDVKEFAQKALVVYDEAHRLGQVTSQRSKLPGLIRGKKTLLLTGTPIRNRPEELAPLINAVSPGSLPNDPQAFRSKFIHTREVPVGFWGRLKGVQPGKERVPINMKEFEKAVRGKVDFYQNADRSTFPSHDEKIFEVPMTSKQQATYDFTLNRYPMLAYKIKHGLPPNKSEESNFASFLSGPRQVSNHPGGFNVSATDEDAPKIRAMADEIEKRYKKDKNFRGVSYSNFLASGLHPLSRELKRRGIPHNLFTGELNDKQRKKTVEDYNTGKNPILLLSGAGSEGLDLKGTKLMQIAEPHWQEEQIDQVRGRAIRYKSHAHLPENERHVEVQRFHTIPQARLWDRLMGRKRSGEKGVDEYLHEMAGKKRKVNQAFLDVMKQPQAPKPMATPQLPQLSQPVMAPAKAAEFEEDDGCQWVHHEPIDNQRYPGLLVDLDGTLVEAANYALGQQSVLPNRIEILRAFKAKGYTIVGVTNRSVYTDDPENWDLDTVQAMNQETLQMFEGLLDDIIFIPFGPTSDHKPAPTMLLYAMTKYKLDPENTVMVGNTDDDLMAAGNAGLPFVWMSDFFEDPAMYADLPGAIPREIDSTVGEEKEAAWTDQLNMVRHVRKHSYEFGGPESYLHLEQHLSHSPPPDMKPMNRRCDTVFGANGQHVTRCATGYHSLAHGIMHVKDDESGKTVTLYRKLKPAHIPRLLIKR